MTDAKAQKCERCLYCDAPEHSPRPCQPVAAQGNPDNTPPTYSADAMFAMAKTAEQFCIERDEARAEIKDLRALLKDHQEQCARNIANLREQLAADDVSDIIALIVSRGMFMSGLEFDAAMDAAIYASLPPTGVK